MFAPLARYLVPVVEEAFEAGDDEQGRGHVAEEAEGRFVVYLVAQGSAFGVRFDDVTVTPTVEGAFELDVFKHAWRVVEGVAGDPALFDEAEDACLDDGGCAGQQVGSALDDARLFPGRSQSPEHVGQFVKGEDAFGRRVYQALFGKVHLG